MCVCNLWLNKLNVDSVSTSYLDFRIISFVKRMLVRVVRYSFNSEYVEYVKSVKSKMCSQIDQS